MAIGNPISSQNNYRVVRFTATASQTLFTITDGYAINKIAVYRNGVRLSENLDFTASDATTVTLNDACELGDEVVFEILDTFKVAQVGDITGNVTGNLTGDVYAGIVTATIRFDGDLAGSVNGGIVTCTELDVNGNADISGNVTIGGTLTYDDVTNVDSLGIVTAREGVHFGTVSDGTLVVGNSTGIGIGTTNPTAKLDVNGDLIVSGVSTLGTVQISSGIVTASSGIVTYYGDGSGLTNLPATGAAGSDGQVQYNNGGAVGGASALYYDDINNRVGVGTTNPTAKLDVDGTLNVTGISTFDDKVALGSSVYDSNGGTGTDGQVLSSVPGIGVSWTDQTGGGASGVATGVTLVQSDTENAFHYVNFTERLTGDEPIRTDSQLRWQPNTQELNLGSGNITLATITSDIFTSSTTGTDGVTIADDIKSVRHINSTGVVTALSFSGDGSNLSNLPAVGSGVSVRDNDSPIGFAGTINFGSNLSVSALSAGVVTVTGSSGSSDSYWVQTDAGIHTLSNVGIGTTNPTQQLEVLGTSKLDGNVNLPDDRYLRFGQANGGDMFIAHIFSVNTIATGSDILEFNCDTINFKNGADDEFLAKFVHNSSVELYYDNSKKFETTSVGATVFGDFYATNLYGDGSGLTGLTGVSAGIDIKDSDSPIGIAGTINFGANLSVSALSAGVVTVTGSSGSSDSYWAQTDVGIHTLSNVGVGTTNPQYKLEVLGGSKIDGNLNLPNDRILTFGTPNGSNYYIGRQTGENLIQTGNESLSLVCSAVVFKNRYTDETIAKFLEDGAVELYYDNTERFETTSVGATVFGDFYATNLYGDGSNLTGISGGGSGASEINDLSDAVTFSSGRSVGLGTGALVDDNGTNNDNTALGYKALNANTSGGGMTGIGHSALAKAGDGSGDACTAVGYFALNSNTSGSDNTAVGYQALQSNVSSQRSTALGYQALESSTGSYNTGLGCFAGDNITSGSNLTCVGYNAEASSATATNEITLGDTNVTKLRVPGIGITFGDNTSLTDGHVLTYSSSTGEVKLAAVSGGVANAAGSDGQVQYNNGGTSLGGASALYYDDINNRVGIGTTIPAYELQVGNIGVNPNVTTGSISTALFSYHLGIGHTQLSRTSAKPDYHEHGAILTLGAPSSKTAYIIIDANRSSSNDWGSVAIGDYRNLANGGPTNNVAIGGGNLYNCTSSGNIAIGNQNLEDLSSSSSYNIGIGYQTLINVTSSSTGNIALGHRAGRNSGSSIDDNIFIGDNAGDLVLSSNSSDNIYIGRNAGSDGTATQRDRNIVIGNVPAAKVGDDQFAIGVDNGTDNYWLVGDENFNVGIGTTNPTAAVGVGNTAVLAVGIVSAYQVYVNGSPVSGGGGGGGGSSDSYWAQTDVGIHTLSNVGIGTTNPQNKLEVLGTSKFDGNVNLPQNNILTFGAANGGNMFIGRQAGVNAIQTGNGTLNFNCTTVHFKNGTDNESIAKFKQNGSVELYYDNDKKFETQGMGVTVTGRTSTNTLDVAGISTFGNDITVQTESKVAFGHTSLDRHDAHLKLYQSGLFEIKNENTEGDSGSGVIQIQSNTNDVRLKSITNQVKLFSNGSNERLRTENAGVRITGFCTVTGAISKGSGSFRIDHPVTGMSTTHDLVHSFIEGPQADLIYRGSVDLVSGIGTVNIDTAARMTEGTFDALCTNVQCFTSNETDWTAVKGSVSGNILTITAQDSSSTATVGWMVVGERKDQHMIDTHWTDENGRVIVEPTK